MSERATNLLDTADGQISELVDLLSAVVSKSYSASEQYEDATHFFALLIRIIAGKARPADTSPNGDVARSRIGQWLDATDPLQIAKDHECGDGRPTGR